MRLQAIQYPTGTNSKTMTEWWDSLTAEEQEELNPKVRKDLEKVDFYTGIEYLMIAWHLYHNIPMDREFSNLK